MELLEYCDVCFFKVKPNLCETYKGTFTKISSVHFSQQNKIDRILNRFNTRAKLVNRRWTCIVAKSDRKEFLDSLWGIGVTVHTLEDHVRILKTLYKPEVRQLGELSEIEVDPNEVWQEFDPQKHLWQPLEISRKTVKIKLGTILKSTDLGVEKYFRTITSDGKTTLIPIEKRAAYNIIVTQSEPTKAIWQTDKKNQFGFIKEDYLENLPEEIFSTLIRFQSDKKITKHLSFDEEDYELIKTILESVKIELQRTNDVVDLTNEKKEDKIVLELNKIESDRINAFSKMVFDLGGKLEQKDNSLHITGKLDSISLNFIREEKSNQNGRILSIPISALEDPFRISDLLLMLRKRLGLLPISIEQLVCQRWPILSDSDLQYSVQSLIEYWKIDKNLALSMIQEKEKFDKINEWNNQIKTGKIRSNLDTIVLGKILKARNV